MFIEFKFGNFRSFRDTQKFTMLASPKRPNDSGLDENNVYEDNGLRFLKSKAIYGANASGKSNLVKAIGVFCLMVTRSVSIEGITKKIWSDRFQLISDWDEQPIFFQYVFSFNNQIYRYGFQILDSKVTFEWLFQGEKNDEIELFIREDESLSLRYEKFPGSEIFANQIISKDNELFRPDSLFLTAAALNGNKLATALRDEIRKIMAVNGVYDDKTYVFGMHTLNVGDDETKSTLKKLLNAADTGIENIEVLDVPNESFERNRKDLEESGTSNRKQKVQALFSTHSRFDENGNLFDKITVPFDEWESDGTVKLFGIGAIVIDALKKGRILVIDEFDARFHPNLTLKIVNLFNNSDTNPKKAQLIFVTHDTGLLRRADLRRDQIALVNRDKYGLSSISTLIEFKGVRKDSSYEKEYLNGSYSAVPFLDEIDLLLKEKSK